MKYPLLATVVILVSMPFAIPVNAQAERISCFRNNNVIDCPGYGSFNYRNNDDNNYRPNQNSVRIINEIYLDILGRRADAEGLRTYTRDLNNGTSVSKIRRDLANSSEAQQVLNRLYREILGRNIDGGSLQTYRDMLANGRSLNDVRTEISYNSNNNNNSSSFATINDIYQDVLGRRADPEGLRTYSRALNNGSSVSKIRRELAYSPEAEQAINRIYLQVLRRNVDSSGLRTYRDFLANGRSLIDLRRELSNSPEARGQF